MRSVVVVVELEVVVAVVADPLLVHLVDAHFHLPLLLSSSLLLLFHLVVAVVVVVYREVLISFHQYRQ